MTNVVYRIAKNVHDVGLHQTGILLSTLFDKSDEVQFRLYVRRELKFARQRAL